MRTRIAAAVVGLAAMAAVVAGPTAAYADPSDPSGSTDAPTATAAAVPDVGSILASILRKIHPVPLGRIM